MKSSCWNSNLEHDVQLDELTKIISRQKEMGLAISQELDLQAELIDQAEVRVDRAQTRVSHARRSIERILRGNNDKRELLMRCSFFS